MKRIITVALIVVMILTAIPAMTASADEGQVRDLGTMYVSKLNSIWDDPVNNCLIFIMPGSSVSGVYYHKLYAVYDDAKGGYVVEKKVPAHLSYTKAVGTNAIGICFNYTTIVSKGASEAIKNWKVWTRIREGDLLTLEGIDVKAKTADISGEWGTSGFVSNAKINVTTTREEFSGSAYSDVRIVALGDSLTPNGGWTERIGDMLGTDIINSGEGADRTDEAINRFNRDVAAYNPDIVLIMFGANDLNQGSSYSPSYVTKFENNLQTLYDKCKAIGAKVVFMTPTKMLYSAYEARFVNYGGIDYCYKQFLSTIKKVAERNGCVFVDNFTQYESIENIEDYIIDTGHPNEKGYNMIIGTISEALIYNAVELTGKKTKDILPQSSNCRIYKDKYLTGLTSISSLDQLKAQTGMDVEVEGDIATGSRIKLITDRGYISVGLKILVKGDANGDGKVDQTDILKIKSVFLNTGSINDPDAFEAADISGNGKINVTDYIAIKRGLLGTLDLSKL
ncbi:MAG: hypothetical protein IJS94_03635 [Clostridia bacterium]|nr:hypothetical protein [Clostridia bacterium]